MSREPGRCLFPGQQKYIPKKSLCQSVHQVPTCSSLFLKNSSTHLCLIKAQCKLTFWLKYFLSCSFRGWDDCWLENSRLPLQQGCYMSWHSKVSMYYTRKAAHLSWKSFSHHFCFFFSGYLKAKIISGTRWSFFTACFCPPVRRDRA